MLAANLLLNVNPEAIKLISPGISELRLAAGDSLFVPVKAMVASKLAAGKNHQLSARLVSGNREVASKNLQLQVGEIKMLRMSIHNEHLLYEAEGDTLQIPVQVSNTGNTAQNFQLLSRFALRKGKNELESRQLHLSAFSDTTLVIKRIVNKDILELDNFNISLKALYSNGDLFGSGTVNVSSVKNDRRHSQPLDAENYNYRRQNNMFSMSAQTNRGNMQYFLYANNESAFKNGSLNSNIDVNWWENSDHVMLRNTWLGYDSENFGIKAGNIFRSGELNLFGRGVETYFKTDSNRLFEAGGIDKTYDLLASGRAGVGKAGWIGFSKDGGANQNGYEVNIVYEDEPRTNLRNILASGKMNVVNKRNLKIRTGLSASNSMLYSNAGINKGGGAGEFSFFARDGNFTVNGDYFYSSGYYSGLKQGLTQINQRVNYQYNAYSFWAAYNLMNFQPKSLSGAQSRISNFSNDRYALGMTKDFRNFSLSLSPNYYYERRKDPHSSNDETGEIYKMDAARLVLGLNYSHPVSGQSSSLNIEGGFFNTNKEQYLEPHYKINFSYNWKFFNLHAFHQYHNFYLGEVISAERYNNEGIYTQTNIMPSVQQSFFDKKLRLRAGVSFSENSLSNDYFQFNGRIDYQLPFNFDVFFSTFYSDFSSYYYDTSTMHFGIIKRFGAINLKNNKHRLEVFVYTRNLGEDAEQTNKPAAGQLVIINNKIFRTDDKGLLTYKKLPEGPYKIQLFNMKEWYAPDREVELNDDLSIAIEMNRSIAVKGKISYVFTEQSFEIEKKYLGHTLVFTGQNGKTYTTRTDGKGNFRIYIPDGTYTVSFDNSSLPEVVEVQENHRMVKIDTKDETFLEFKLKVRDRRIDRMKFDAIPFSRPNP